MISNVVVPRLEDKPQPMSLCIVLTREKLNSAHYQRNLYGSIKTTIFLNADSAHFGRYALTPHGPPIRLTSTRTGSTVTAREAVVENSKHLVWTDPLALPANDLVPEQSRINWRSELSADWRAGFSELKLGRCNGFRTDLE